MPITSHSARRRVWLVKSLFLLALLVASFAVSQPAWAQVSATYDLACRGALTAGGGIIATPGVGAATVASFGQWTSGVSQSATYEIHTGFVQRRARTAAAAPTVDAAALQAPAQATPGPVFLPVIRSVGRVIRVCVY
jgi:hypothetical protein